MFPLHNESSSGREPLQKTISKFDADKSYAVHPSVSEKKVHVYTNWVQNVFLTYLMRPIDPLFLGKEEYSRSLSSPIKTREIKQFLLGLCRCVTQKQ